MRKVKAVTKTSATSIGFIAILLWGLLALLTSFSGNIPPFQLLAMCFTQTFILMLAKWLIKGESIIGYMKQPVAAWILGISGLFGYHFCYFVALSKAPALEASLIAYLWPLLILLFSTFLPGEKLLIRHVIGAVLSLVGCWLLLGGAEAGQNGGFDSEYLVGYLFAAACSLIWSSYSVLSRMVKKVPTDALGWFCGASAVMGWLCHFTMEETVIPSHVIQWVGVFGLGLGPVGLAFFFWDYGMKYGDIQLLGVLSYSAPLISTVVLVLFTDAVYTHTLLVACSLIMGGALIAGYTRHRKSRIVNK